MQIVVLATGSFAVPMLDALCAAGHSVLRAISQPDRPAGRGRAVKPTPVHSAAKARGIAHLQVADVNALPIFELFGDAELGVVAAFGQKIGPAILRAMPRGCINLHGSLLPRYRGAAPYQWAILNGERTTGVTVFQLNEQWDAGAIWGRRETDIGETETADELHDRLAVLGADLMVECLARMARGEMPQPQDASHATRAPKLKKTDGFLDWRESAEELARKINGLWSWPGATADFVSRTSRRERVQLARARVAEDAEPVCAEGAAIAPAPDVHPLAAAVLPGGIRSDGSIQTSAGSLRILEIKPAGKPLMDFVAFANGRNVAVGDRFEQPEGDEVLRCRPRQTAISETMDAVDAQEDSATLPRIMALSPYFDFTARLKLLVSKHPGLVAMTLSNIFTMRLFGNKTHGDLAEIAISEFINQYMYDFKSVHVGKTLYRAKSREEDIQVTNEITNVSFPISLKAYGDGPLQLSTDKASKMFPRLRREGDVVDDPVKVRALFEGIEFVDVASLNVLPLVYNEKQKQCNILVFDYVRARNAVTRIVHEHDGMGRKHPIYRFYDVYDQYVCEVRYGDAAANALQRGLWTNTKRGLKYFDSITNGWITYEHNLVLVHLLSHALVASPAGHTAALAQIRNDIYTLKRAEGLPDR